MITELPVKFSEKMKKRKDKMYISKKRINKSIYILQEKSITEKNELI
jgi:hypothetical protein